jgi:hypothetical protein
VLKAAVRNANRVFVRAMIINGRADVPMVQKFAELGDAETVRLRPCAAVPGNIPL